MNEPVTTWKTRKGVVIPIIEMADEHLLNAIRYLRRNARTILAAQIVAMVLGPKPRGTHAQDAFERELIALENANAIEFLDGHDAYQALVSEARKRKLAEEDIFLNEQIGSDRETGDGAV